MGKRDALKPWLGCFRKVAAVAFFLPAVLELRERDWKKAIGTQGNEGSLASPTTQPEARDQAPKGGRESARSLKRNTEDQNSSYQSRKLEL